MTARALPVATSYGVLPPPSFRFNPASRRVLSTVNHASRSTSTHLTPLCALAAMWKHVSPESSSVCSRHSRSCESRRSYQRTSSPKLRSLPARDVPFSRRRGRGAARETFRRRPASATTRPRRRRDAVDVASTARCRDDAAAAATRRGYTRAQGGARGARDHEGRPAVRVARRRRDARVRDAPPDRLELLVDDGIEPAPVAPVWPRTRVTRTAPRRRGAA